MIKTEHFALDSNRGFQVIFKNDITGKNLYLVCPPDQDLEQFKIDNFPIAELETA